MSRSRTGDIHEVVCVFDGVALGQIGHVIQVEEGTKVVCLDDLDVLERRLLAEQDLLEAVLYDAVIWNISF